MSFLGGLFGNSADDKSAPISLSFKSARGPSLSVGPLSIGLPSPPVLALGIDELLSGGTQIRTFDSYSFERNMLAPATPFRFTAPNIDKKTRLAVRSGDTVQLLATDRNGKQIPIATGFIDETDTHISASRVEYVLTGRDTLGQLVDNAAVDKQNKIINIKNVSMETILKSLILNTRIPQQVKTQQLDNGSMLFQTQVSETKMNCLQRYMEFTNSLIWTKPNGQVVLGKPNFIQIPQGILTVGTLSEEQAISAALLAPQSTNVLDCRVRRNLNHSIRQIVNQMQNQNQTDAGFYTIFNQDSDMQEVFSSGVGRSVYRVFSFGEGANAVNFIFHVANIPGMPNQLGAAYSLREIARENLNVLDVEIKVQGHLNSNGNVYDVDQMYYCNIPDEDISDNLYCYAVTHELTLEHGMISTLRLCKLGSLVAGSFQIPIPSVSL